ncbi:hypothetical protein A6J40_09205 [Legionella longbeachae]|uniref:hypothetical protein n=1 Tax=Legionella longbeachae TaxID=450 RepID=UPI0009B799F3|nr:hypothetical protein [Legionella longbeachae]ARB92339.1 hypothetical protein A6J40_09205 [Legionella longbeachae]RZV24156.1 hypothetical protein EKG34_11130 [Legionella longbeachae]UAK47766.1 hypothetical protein K8O86_06220 [Legionella longbeachae]VEE01296.1 Uncharacterised protein [Legionella oakridgensis]
MLFYSKLHQDFFSAAPDFIYIYHLINKVHHKECTHLIESLSTLEKLLTEKRLRKEEPILRFLVDTNGIAWFARENQPDISAPKHFQMTGESQNQARCLTAGNIKFTNPKCRVLKSINHRSGDFQPSFYSLRIFLAIRILNEAILPFKLPRILVVKELNAQGEVACKHRWLVAKIKEWVSTFNHNEELTHRLKNQCVETKQVHYKSTTDEFCYPN